MVQSSYLPILSFVAVTLSTVLLLVAFSTDHWLVSADSTATGADNFNFGLWTSCYREVIDVPADVSGNGTVSTESVTRCESTHDWIDKYFEGV